MGIALLLSSTAQRDGEVPLRVDLSMEGFILGGSAGGSEPSVGPACFVCGGWPRACIVVVHNGY